MWRPRADRGPGAGRFVRDLGPLPLSVALLLQANRNHTSHRDFSGEHALNVNVNVN